MAFVVSLGGSVSKAAATPPIYYQPLTFLIGLFILDGVIAIPIPLLGFFVMPGMGRRPPAKSTKKVVGFFTMWHIWFVAPRNSFSSAPVGMVPTDHTPIP